MDTPPIRIVRDAVTRAELTALAERQFGDMVKAVAEGLREAIRGVVGRLVTGA